MKLSEAFAPSVTLRQFFEDILPQLHDDYLEDFNEFSDIDVIVSVHLLDTGERYTVELGRDGMHVERGEMIDFPMVTIEGWAKYWDEVKRHTLEFMQILEEADNDPSDGFRLTADFFDDFERYDVVIDIDLVETIDFPSIKMRAILNDYEDNDRCTRFGVSVPLSLIRNVCEGNLSPEAGARSLDISGDVKTAMNLGGMILSHAD